MGITAQFDLQAAQRYKKNKFQVHCNKSNIIGETFNTLVTLLIEAEVNERWREQVA